MTFGDTLHHLGECRRYSRCLKLTPLEAASDAVRTSPGVTCRFWWKKRMNSRRLFRRWPRCCVRRWLRHRLRAAERPPIVFVHGNGDTAALWQTATWRFESTAGRASASCIEALSAGAR
jgi:hypothetical protein